MLHCTRFLRLLVVICILAFLAGGGTRTVAAYDPTPALRNLSGAPWAVLMLLEVEPGREAEFLDHMVREGPYHKFLSGFANERILQPLPTSGDGALFFCISRYYDPETARFVEDHRLAAVRPLLRREPVRMEVKLVEHVLADWGWERGTPQGTVRAEPFRNEEIFEKNISSLSFFKAGYVGQVGLLEMFPSDLEIAEVRSRVAARTGVSGVSIFRRSDGTGGYVAYSEFFKAPAGADRAAFVLAANGVSGGQAGMVVQNYVPR